MTPKLKDKPAGKVKLERHPNSLQPDCFHCERTFTEEEVEKVCKGLVPGRTEIREFFCTACGCRTPMKVCIE